MGFGPLLTGILAPLVVHSIINRTGMTPDANGGQASMGATPPHFNVNFYNQDQNEVKDNGNHNLQRGNGPQRVPQHVPTYPYPLQHHGVGYPMAIPPYPYYNPYAYLGYPRQNPVIENPSRHLTTHGSPVMPPPWAPLPRSQPLFPSIPSVSPEVNHQINLQLERTSRVIQALLTSEGQRKPEGTNNLVIRSLGAPRTPLLDDLETPLLDDSEPSNDSINTRTIMDEFTELAKDPIYDPSVEIVYNSSDGIKTPLNSTFYQMIRRKRDVDGGN